ncbi:MAG: S8/S53 family peptidase, partial [Acidobacteriota bacterium]|nr:S8/S53 family peptidase [Acidobacteriota bacterium]
MLRSIRALLVFWCLPWAAGAAGCINQRVPSRPVEPAQPSAEPTAEMTGEQWQSPRVPPARDPRVPWYQQLSVDEAWRELVAPHNHNAALVTFKRPELARGYFGGIVLITEDELARARQRLLQIPEVRPWDGSDAGREMPRMPDRRAYPAIVVQIGSLEALRQIRELTMVEAVEPLYLPQGIGCALDAYTPIAADGDFFDNRIPWSFSHLGIVEAWNLYKQANNAISNPGAGIRIGVIDTGVFEDEHQLITAFNWNGTRPAARHHTVVAATWDDCGHGTRIAGLAAAPLDVQFASPRKIVGVAWGADLTTVKYNGGVVLGAGSRVELIEAINLAVADGARVVNLALGTPFWSTFVYDNINMAYETTQTIFVGAAGTFVSAVQFPAKMYPQVLAVSIVKSKDTADPQAGYELYGGATPESAYGSEVAFAAVNGDGGVPTAGGGQGLIQVGGSSSGTAHLSGIIALVWGKQPTATRAQVIARLRSSGSLKRISGEQDLIPGFSAKVGYGIPDAYVAAGGFRTASIGGPSMVMPGASYTLTVSTNGWLPTTVLWDTGQTTP